MVSVRNSSVERTLTYPGRKFKGWKTSTWHTLFAWNWRSAREHSNGKQHIGGYSEIGNNSLDETNLFVYEGVRIWIRIGILDPVGGRFRMQQFNAGWRHLCP